MVGLALLSEKASSHYPEAILNDSLPCLRGGRKAGRPLTFAVCLLGPHDPNLNREAEVFGTGEHSGSGYLACAGSWDQHVHTLQHL